METLQTTEEQFQNSRLGIASFICALLALYLFWSNTSFSPLSFSAYMMIPFGVKPWMLAVFIVFLGVILGIAGCTQKRKKKTYSVWGLVLNLLLFIGIAILFFMVLSHEFGAL